MVHVTVSECFGSQADACSGRDTYRGRRCEPDANEGGNTGVFIPSSFLEGRVFFYYIGNSVPYIIKKPLGDAHNVQRKAAAQPHIGEKTSGESHCGGKKPCRLCGPPQAEKRA